MISSASGAASGFPGATSELPSVLESVGAETDTATTERLERSLSGEGLSDRARGLILTQLGRLAFRAGDYERALARFEAVESTRLPDWLAFHRAESLFHLGRYEGALATYRSVIERFPASSWRHRAHFRLGDALVGAGRPREALDAWARASNRYPEYPARAALRFAMARAWVGLGELERAAALYREIRKLEPGDPTSRVAERALHDLEARGVKPLHPSPEERLTLALDLRRRKYYAEATACLEAMRGESDVTGKLRDEVEWNIARILWESERFSDSLVAFRKIHAESKDGGRRRKAMRWIGYALERTGETEAAAKALAEASGRPTNPPAEVAEDIAWLYFNSAVYEKAGLWFRRLPASVHGQRWMQAWLTFRRGEHKKASDLFGALARAAKVGRERFLYWQARSILATGQREKAASLFREVRAGSTIGYYGYQAEARLAELEGTGAKSARPSVPAASASPTVPPVMPEAPIPILQALVERGGGLFPAAAEALDLAALGESRLAAICLRTISDELRAFRESRPRGRALAAWSYRPKPYLDNREKAKTGEWGRSLDEPMPPGDRRRGPALAGGVSSDFMSLLARAFVAIDDPHYARRHVGGGKLSYPPEADAHRQAWARRFPRAYAQELEAKARKYGLDPHLLWAFMTVESSYNPLAISRANARGLMQIMPQTGGLIADRMALRGFGPPLLFEPEITLEMAAWYVRQLLDKFNGQTPLAMAGYNAGPHRVATWLSRKGNLPMDEFVEEIPYDEAREYTKKVTRFWALYRRIYIGRADLTFDQKVDPKFKNNINF